MFEFNKDRALILFKNEIRAQREGKFSDLDVQFMRAVEAGNTTLQATIAQQKQQLRDITDDPLLSQASDVTELKSVMNQLVDKIKNT